jgi:ABC-type lipoprotein release transport system permease subunit
VVWTTSRYAVRSLGRNVRRTALSILGIGVVCMLVVFMESLNRGKGEMIARAGALGGLGHIRIVPAHWAERRDVRLRLSRPDAHVAAARTLPGVSHVTARARAPALLALGTHAVPVEIVGVEADVEPRVFRYVQVVQEGRYLLPQEANAIVIGRSIADRLTADLGDEIVATTVGAAGDIQSALFRIAGIVSTGSDDADAAVCQVTRSDLERLTGLSGAGEVSVVLDDYRRIDAVRAALAPLITGGDTALTMGELNPEIEGHLEQDEAASRFVSLIILLIAVLGVTSAQLAAVLERRREFAILSALGMSSFAVVRLIVQEALMLGLGGAVAGLALAVPVTRYFAHAGVDFRPYYGSSAAFQGVLIDPVFYGDFGPWIVPYTGLIAIGATVCASLYPAWYASRTDPTMALRVAQ